MSQQPLYDRHSYLTREEHDRFTRASIKAAGYDPDTLPPHDTPEYRLHFEAYCDGVYPIRAVGVNYWFDIHKQALTVAMRSSGIVPRGMSRMNKGLLVRACIPILFDLSSPIRKTLLVAIRREADAYDMQKWGRIMGERGPISPEFADLL